MVTVMQLIQKKNEIQDMLRQVEVSMRSIPFAHYSIDALKLLNDDMFLEPSDALIRVLNERDVPMSYADIKQAFQISGFEFTETDILNCHPESQDEVDAWEREINRHLQ